MKSVLDCTTTIEIEAHDKHIERMFERIYERFKDSNNIRVAVDNFYKWSNTLESVDDLQELLDMFDYKNGCDIKEKMDQFLITVYGQFLDSHDIILFKD